MKIISIAAVFCCFSICAFAQKSDKEIRDVVNLRCYYVLSKRNTTAEKPYRTDTMLLDVGAKISRFYDPARLSRDSAIHQLFGSANQQNIKSINIYKGAEAKDFSKMPGTVMSNTMEGESYQIVKDKHAGVITVFDYVGATGTTKLQYEDKVGKLNWELVEVTDTIAGYPCQKAILKFRGRNYAAWFTTEIPVSDGPWKFSGLPGLILKVEDADQLFSFSLIGLTQPKTPFPLFISKSDYLKCTRAEFDKQVMKRGMGMQINLMNGDMSIAEISGKYEPVSMELE
ncbi:GLPGLI family protein [Pedobacter psychroterrae]|uniref:GLPGLI family protein n=1 Tax=Pedobacter psychroterrae TaxID=2530453 RepID=A0A4R0NF05_9SPHI|nr:GLPGLI family protein [Pedobacter psychroterrae]TCC98297.1 GLPGLI family protein [Pedobacter psychroterrae]